MTWSWWLVNNTHGHMRYTFATSAAEARQNIRDGIVQQGRDEGMTWRDARRYATTYGVEVIAGGCSYAEAVAAADAWNAEPRPDEEPARTLQRRHLEAGGKVGAR